MGDSYDRLQPWSNPNATSSDITNVLNPFGHKENFTFGGRFGAANTNSAGFLARELLDILEEIVADKNATFGGRIKYGNSEYTIDFGELKDVPEFFRIGGQSSNLSNIIAECAEILQYDYFASIKVPEELEDGGGVLSDPEIEVKTIEKTSQPEIDTVSTLVANAKRDGTHVSSEIGQELSDEILTE